MFDTTRSSLSNLAEVLPKLSKVGKDALDPLLSIAQKNGSLSDLTDSEISKLSIELEKISKVSELLDIDLGAASKIEDYVSYESKTRSRNRINGIYVIIDPQATNSRDLVQIAASVINGGVSVLQYRDKQSDRSEFLENADALKQLCDSANVAFIVNDAADVAKLVGSSFLHVGQSDLDVNSAREILAPFQCIGRSNNGLLQAKESESEGADYLAVGAVYSTNTMGKSNRRPVGPETLSDVKESTELPVVAIGGIDSSNISEVQASGVDSACVVSAITFADDPEKATKHLVDLWGNR